MRPVTLAALACALACFGAAAVRAASPDGNEGARRDGADEGVDDVADAAAAAAVDRRAVVVTLVDALDGTPLARVRCFLQGGGFLGGTGDDGTVALMVPPGDVVVSFVHARTSPRIVRIAASTSALTVELLPSASELAEMTVHAPHIEGSLGETVLERREEKQVVEVIGAEQMKRSGDGDAAAALKRAAGLTVVGGRYAYVRGLGERYSTTLLDGAGLPSPEPERRVVPLDMFPTGFLSGVVVQKTWSPELPGDFGGGAVMLKTRRIPEEPFLDVSLGLAGALGTTFTQAPMYRGGSLDFLGFDDGTRGMPADLRAASAEQILAEKGSLTPGGYTPKQLEAFGESLSPIYSTRQELVPPSASLGVTFGQRTSLPWADVGVIGALSWSQDWQHSTIERHRYAVGAGGALTALEDATIEATDRNVALGGLLGVGLEMDGHALQSTTFLQRLSDDEVRVLEGYDRDVNTDVRATRLRWVERALVSERLSGEHALPFLSSVLSWRYGYAMAARDEPDQRETRYDRDVSSGAYLLSDRPEGNQRLFSTLSDHSHDAQVTWGLPLPRFFSSDRAEPELHLGAGLATKSRAVDTRRYKLLFHGARASDAELRAQAAEQIFAPGNIGSDGFQIGESTRKTDNYGGLSVVVSTFALAHVPLPFDVALSGGVRVEAAHIAVTTFELFNAGAAPTEARLDTVDVLPALSATWAFAEDMQLRVAGALTLARPELRELSPAVFTDVTAGRSRFGNPDLLPASIAHVDARWEWYPSPSESVSVAAFGKRFDKPIETVITPGADQSITYENAASAIDLGLELEARVGLGFIHSLVEELSIGGNGALIWSEVELPEDGIQTSSSRPLEGQSPWVVNAQLAWDHEGTTLSVLSNVFGARIRDVGVLGAPDVYEQPFHQLDIVLVQELPGGLTLSAKAQNLLDGETLLTQGGEVMERSKRGPSFSASLGWSL